VLCRCAHLIQNAQVNILKSSDTTSGLFEGVSYLRVGNLISVGITRSPPQKKEHSRYWNSMNSRNTAHYFWVQSASLISLYVAQYIGES